jgi:hypothetical protein
VHICKTLLGHFLASIVCRAGHVSHAARLPGVVKHTCPAFERGPAFEREWGRLKRTCPAKSMPWLTQPSPLSAQGVAEIYFETCESGTLFVHLSLFPPVCVQIKETMTVISSSFTFATCMCGATHMICRSCMSLFSMSLFAGSGQLP